MYVAAYAQPISVAWAVIYVVTWALTALYLLHFAWRLWNIGERGQAIWFLVATAAGSVVVGPYEFFQIPGDDENHTIFYIFALSTWAFMLTAYYYGYGAMHHHNERRESDLLAVESSIAVMRQPYVRPEKDNSIATSTTLEATSTTEDAIADVDGVEITNSYGHVDY